jgi:hypothetical protein
VVTVTARNMNEVMAAGYSGDDLSHRPFHLIIPVGTVAIDDRAFHRFRGLVSVSIPISVTSIGDFAFGGCSGLESIVIPNGVTIIGKSAFSRCIHLVSV